MSPNPINLKNEREYRRLKGNLEGQGRQKKRAEDPEQTIKRLRAEVAVLRELLEQKQAIIDALNREIGAIRKGVDHE